MNWQESATEQNLRLTQKMLEQQGRINRLTSKLAELEADNKNLHQGVANLADANTALTSELAEVRAAASRREGYLQLQAEGQLQASSSWQREAHRLKAELEKLINPTDADCTCGEEYAEQDCLVHGVLRLLLASRDENVELRAVLADLVDQDDCSSDLHAGCSAHGYTPGQKCPVQVAKDLLSR